VKEARAHLKYLSNAERRVPEYVDTTGRACTATSWWATGVIPAGKIATTAVVDLALVDVRTGRISTDVVCASPIRGVTTTTVVCGALIKVAGGIGAGVVHAEPFRGVPAIAVVDRTFVDVGTRWAA
jgi:hypothetical protein